MGRTAVYRSHTRSTASERQRGPDNYVSKIAKYVPAETVSIATLFFATFTVSGMAVWACVAVGAVVNSLYLYVVAQMTPNSPQPRGYFYALSALAFVLWSLAVIDTVARAGHLTGSSGDGQRAFILTAAAFFIPLLDSLFSLPPRKAPEPAAGNQPAPGGG